MLITLTQAQCTQINAAAYTHNYSEEAVQQHLASDDDVIEKYTDKFEASIAHVPYTTANDIGGLIVYLNGHDIVAFYDYENFAGAIL